MPAYWKYYFFTFFAITICVGCGVGFFLYEPGQDHPGAISLNGDSSWYMSFRTDGQEIQDNDVLFYDIGRSIENLRQADIVILGHSMVLFALDWRMIEEFSRKHGVRIFNMGVAGGSGVGDFLLRTIRKHAIHPFLFVINADDLGGNFLQRVDGAKGYSHWQALKNVVRRNFRWRMENRLSRLIPWITKRGVSYRSARHGNWFLGLWPLYNDRQPRIFINNTREPDCHATEKDFDEASRYLNALGDNHVVLTLIPYLRSCRPRVREIAERVGVPFIDVDWHGMTTVDAGDHLDAGGAMLFTAEFLRQLEQMPLFLALLDKKKGEGIQPGTVSPNYGSTHETERIAR